MLSNTEKLKTFWKLQKMVVYILKNKWEKLVELSCCCNSVCFEVETCRKLSHFSYKFNFCYQIVGIFIFYIMDL